MFVLGSWDSYKATGLSMEQHVTQRRVDLRALLSHLEMYEGMDSNRRKTRVGK